MNTIIEKIRAEVERRKKAIHSTLFNDEYNDFLRFLSDLEKEEKPMNPQPVKELLTFDGFVDKVGSWFANLELRRFRKTFDGEIYPATELVQAYEWFVHELSEKYREKHPQEQPVSKDLEEEFCAYCYDFKNPETGEELVEDECSMDMEQARMLARHFAKWGAEHRGSSEIPKDLESYAQTIEDYYDVGEERGYLCTHRGDIKNAVLAGAKWQAEHSPLPDDLEEAAVEYSAIGYSPFDDPYEKHQQFECSKFAFIAGAKWDREQMMKEAVSAKALTSYPTDPGNDIFRFDEKRKMMGKFKAGDKVKLIIVKED